MRSAAAAFLTARPLSADAFAPFGDVIARPAKDGCSINAGTSVRYDDIARLDLVAEDGVAQMSMFVSKPRTLPVDCLALEKHPLSSQAFIPVAISPMLVIVAEGEEQPNAATCLAFTTNGHQGVNYRRGVWHHPLVALTGNATFIVVDRAGSTNFVLRPFAGGAHVRVIA